MKDHHAHTHHDTKFQPTADRRSRVEDIALGVLLMLIFIALAIAV